MVEEDDPIQVWDTHTPHKARSDPQGILTRECGF